jgi:polyhydroxyalkanoate synthesis regulator phasin
MDELIDQLRTDFRLVRRWNIWQGEWTEDEAQEFVDGIRDAIVTRNVEHVEGWAHMMADYAKPMRELTARIRAFEQRIRDGKGKDDANKQHGS